MKAQEQMKRVVKLMTVIKRHKEYKFLFLLDKQNWNDLSLKKYITSRHRDRMFNIKRNKGNLDK